MVTRQDFLMGTMFAGVLSACPLCARAADAAAGIAPAKPRPKVPGMEPLSELFRIGYGPSSSHTMGPARAGEIFKTRHPDAKRFEVTLYGSLSATGKGRFTDRALENALGKDRTKVIWGKKEQPFHPNGMELRAYGGGSPSQCEYAAQMSLEHCLGLTCDPAKGLVQIPCIERNAMAASRAVVAAEMSMLGDGKHLISFDKIVRVMLETGHDLPSIYRETSKGGIAVRFAGGC